MKFTAIMKLKILTCFLFFSNVILAFLGLEKSSNDIVRWNEGKLKFSDFKAVPPLNMDGARSYSGFSCECICGEYSISIFSETFFDCTQSWIKDKTSIIVLEHEQLHFDITEVYRRKFFEKVNFDTLLNHHNFESRVTKFYNEAMDSKYAMDDLFDSKINHNGGAPWNVVVSEHELWRHRVDSMLLSLEQFSDNIIQRPIP